MTNKIGGNDKYMIWNNIVYRPSIIYNDNLLLKTLTIISYGKLD